MTGVAVRPFLKQGYRALLKPRPRTNEAKQIADLILKQWGSWEADYRELVAGDLGSKAQAATFVGPKSPVAYWEGEARVVDCPLLRVESRKLGRVETRLCVAICTGEKGTTKVWSRTGFVRGSLDNLDWMKFDQLEKIIPAWEHMMKASCLWMIKKLRPMVNQRAGLRRFKIFNRGWFDVSCLSIKDQRLAGYFKDLNEDRKSVHDLIADPKVHRRILSYYQKAFGINDIYPNGKYQFWFNSLRPARLKGGITRERQAIYFMNINGDKAQAAGIACDDSIDGELAHITVIELSRRLGGEV